MIRFTSLSRAGYIGAAVVSLAGTAQAQKLVVTHDEWLTQTCCFNSNEKTFVDNVLNWFGVTSGDNVLLYSSNNFLTNGTFTGYLTSLGLNVTATDTPGSFSGYAAVFSEGVTTLNAAGLGSYVFGGGNVVYLGGTGIGGPAVEAGYSNPFLNQFGLTFQPTYNGVGTSNTSGFASQGPFGSALFSGVSSIYADNGNSIDPFLPVAGVTTQIFYDGQNGVYAAATVGATVPEPATLVLIGSGLLALVPAVRRKRR